MPTQAELLAIRLSGADYYRTPSQEEFASEMGGRIGQRLTRERQRAEYARSEASDVRAIGKLSAELSQMRSAFVARYGDDAIDGKLLRMLAADAGDEVRLSDEAVSMLEDLQTMEKARGELEFREQILRYEREWNPLALKQSETGDAFWAANFDHMSVSSKSDRIAAVHAMYNSAVMQAELTADKRAASDRRRTAEAALVAAGAVLTEGLEGPKLFEVGPRGSIQFDARGLEGLTPDARERAQLVRLAEVLGGRNGLSEVRGALAKALDAQNEYIASHPVVRKVREETRSTEPAPPSEAQLEMRRMYDEVRAKAEAGVRRALAEDAAQKAKAAARGAVATAAPADADPKAAQHKAALELLKRIAEGLKRDTADAKQPDALARTLSVVA